MSQSIREEGKRARNFGNTGIVCTTSPSADGLISKMREKFWELSDSVFKQAQVGLYHEGVTLYPPRVKNRTKTFLIIAEKRCRLCSRRTTCSSVTQLS
jgi:hypothetical protein